MLVEIMEHKEVRFEIGDLLPIGLALIVAGIGIAYGLNVLGDVQESFYSTQIIGNGCNISNSTTYGCSAEYNATQFAIVGTGKIPDKMPLIVTVVVAAVLIGILVKYLLVRYA